MPNIYVFISLFLMGFAVHAKASLTNLLEEVYGESDTVKESDLSRVKEHLQNHLPTCPLQVDLEADATESEFLNKVSCDRLIEEAKASFSRFRMNNIIVDLTDDKKIDEDRQGKLLAVLEKNYEPESSQRIQEREQLVNRFQGCDLDYGWTDSVQFWADAFSCKGVIETAKEAGMTYSDVQDAISVVSSSEEEQVAIRDVPSGKKKERRRTSKP